MSCNIDKNNPEYIALEKEFNTAVAEQVISLNNDVVPTIEQAKSILSNIKVSPNDEVYNVSSNEFKLKRAIEQSDFLYTAYNAANYKQKATILKFIQMNESDQEFLKNNIKNEKEGKAIVQTSSVSKFIGQSSFQGDPEEYVMFKHFGIFMHEVLEIAQTESVAKGISILDVFNRDFFEKSYDNFIKKTPFYIQNLEKEEMFSSLLQFVNTLNSYESQNMVILPEITINGLSANGTRLVGRLDIVLIGHDGKVHVFDFKTKKVKDAIIETEDGKGKLDFNQALQSMASTRYSINLKDKEANTGTGQNLLNISSRTTFDTWILQLDAYENILRQNGIDVGDKTIAALLYQTDEKKVHQGSAYTVFRTQDYYEQTFNTGVKIDGEIRQWKDEPSKLSAHIQKLRMAIQKDIPLKDEEEKRKVEKLITSLNPTEDNAKSMLAIIQEFVTGQLDTVRTKIKHENTNVNKNESLIEALETRKDSLQRFEIILTKNDKITSSDKLRSINFYTALDIIESAMNELHSNLMDTVESYYDNKQAGKKTIKQVETITYINQSAQALYPLIQEMNNIINELAKDPNSGLDKTSNIRVRLGELEMFNNEIVAAFTENSIESAIKIFEHFDQQTVEKVQKDIRNAETPKLISLEQELEQLKNGMALGPFKKARLRLLYAWDKSAKEKYEQDLSPEGVLTLRRIEEIGLDIKKINDNINGLSYSKENLRKLIDNITDPNSLMYVGSETFNPDSWTKNIRMDDAIAGASNADLAISATVNMLKQSQFDARNALQSDVHVIELAKEIEKQKKLGRTVEEMNAPISEWRTVEYIDSETGEKSQKTSYYMVKPYSIEYESIFRMYNVNIKKLNNDIKVAKTEYNDHFRKADEAVYKQKLVDSKNALITAKENHLAWMIENSSLPYVTEFYELQQKLPDDIREKLQHLNIEIETILHGIGKGTIDMLDESMFDELMSLEVEKRKLKTEARERDASYGDYLDKFEALYETDTNIDYFQRMRDDAINRYGGNDTEEFIRWEKINQVNRPKQSWYDAQSKLFEQREELFGSDPVISDLIKQRTAIMYPHKENGRFSPRFLNAEEIRELDRIENLMDEYILDKQENGEKLSHEDMLASKAISEALNRLVQKQIAPAYIDLFNQKTKLLYDLKQTMDLSEANLIDSQTKGVYEDIKKAEHEYGYAISQFEIYEKEFENWYNLNHYNKYQSITTGFNVKDNNKPKGFNMERLPVDHSEMETVPNPKYFSVKRLRKENWYVDGKHLSSKDIAELKKDEQLLNALRVSGKLEEKPGAYNENFLKSPDGFPMPNNIVLDGNGHYITNGNLKNINPKYVELLNNPNDLGLYHKMTDLSFDLQKRIKGKTTGYEVNGYSASQVENLYNGQGNVDLGGFVKRGVDKFIDKNFDLKNSEQDFADNVFGTDGTNLRLKHTRQLSENLQSKDTLGCILKFAVEAHHNIALQESAPLLDSLISGLELKKVKLEKMIASGKSFSVNEGKSKEVDMGIRLKQLTHVIEQLQYEQRKFIYGQADMSKNQALKKVINNLFAYTSFIRIGFDMANQMKNYTAGNVQTWIASGGAESNNYAFEDLMWAKKKVYGYNGFFRDYFADWGMVHDLHESTMLYRLFDPMMKNPDKYYDQVTNSRSRRLFNKVLTPMELGYLLQDKGDTEIGVTVMYAVMNRAKFKVITGKTEEGENIYEKDSEGNDITISAHECYVKGKNGELVRRDDVSYTKEDESRLRQIIYSEMRRAQGNYAKTDQTKMEEDVMGKLVFFFKKFLVPQLLNRFGYLRPNWEGSEAAIGYWRAMYRAGKYFGAKSLMSEFILGSKMTSRVGITGLNTMITKGLDGEKVSVDVGDFYQRKIGQARKDAGATIMLLMLTYMSLSYIRRKDDDNEELSMVEGNLLRILLDTKGETIAMNPFAGGSQNYIRNFTQAIPFVREFTYALKIMDHTSKYTLSMIMNGGNEPEPGYDSELYTEVWKDAFYNRKSGVHEKGDIKFVKDLVDMTGIRNFVNVINPNERIDMIKGKQ